ncbi:hypothetical protein Tco_1352452 [Tanacetum coccineum]
MPSPTHPSVDQPESQPDPSPRPSSPNHIPDSNPEGSGGNHGEQNIRLWKAQIKQLKKKARPVINNHKAWFRAAMLKKQRKKKDMEKPKKRRSVSKQGRKAVKSSKGSPSVQTNADWDALDTDLDETINEAMDYNLAQDEGKTDSKVEEPKTSSKTEELHLSGDTLVVEDKGSAKKGGSTKGTDLQQSTVKLDEGTDKQNGGTDRTKVSTDSFVEGTVEIKDQVLGESDTLTIPTMASTPTLTVFGDDETIAQVLVTMKSEDIIEAEKKFNMLVNDKEMAKKVQEEWEAEEEKKRLAEEEATKIAFANEYGFIQARFNTDKILAEKLQEEDREKFTIKERAKLLHDTIAAQRRFLAQQRSEANKNLNKKAAGIKKADNIKKESKEVEGTKKRKLGTRKKMKSRKRRFRQDTFEDDETNSEKENDELRLCLTVAPDEDKEMDYEILDKKYPIIEWKSDHLRIKPQYDETKDLEEINLNVVIRSRVHTLMTDEGLVIHMLVEKQYPLRKKVLVQMLELKLESEEDNTMALKLIRFVKKLIAELEPEKLDGDACEKILECWFSIHLVVYNEELAIPEQMATGKGISNSLMAGGLPKTTKPT